jgi:hypothetical protein
VVNLPQFALSQARMRQDLFRHCLCNIRYDSFDNFYDKMHAVMCMDDNM